MMSKKSPQLRFEGFTDDWEERKVKDIFKITRGQVLAATETSEEKSDISPFPVYSSQTKNNGLMGYYKDYLFDTAITWTTDGANAGTVSYRSGRFYSTNVNGVLISDKGYTNKAISEILNLEAWKWVSHVGNPKLMNNVMGDISIMIPSSFEEQDRLSNFLNQLDDTITLHQRKLDLLKEQKKGYLQKMFPKNGAKVPELRFAGFADDWEERKLGEVIDIENGYAFKSEYFSDEEKRHIVLTPGSVKIGGGFQKDKGRYYDVSGVFPEKFIFKPGNIFITMTDLTPTAQSLGYPAIVPRDDNVYLHNQRLGKIINTTTNPEFLYTLLTTDTYHKEIVSSASGTTVKHSSVSKILDFKSAIPNIDEQKLIGSFFKELDNTIALHQRKLDLLKEQKKGFLQKMFV